MSSSFWLSLPFIQCRQTDRQSVTGTWLLWDFSSACGQTLVWYHFPSWQSLQFFEAQVFSFQYKQLFLFLFFFFELVFLFSPAQCFCLPVSHVSEAQLCFSALRWSTREGSSARVLCDWLVREVWGGSPVLSFSPVSSFSFSWVFSSYLSSMATHAHMHTLTSNRVKRYFLGCIQRSLFLFQHHLTGKTRLTEWHA